MVTNDEDKLLFIHSGDSVEELEDLNHSLRNRDKMKDDAIAHLSDQLMVIATRLQEVESENVIIKLIRPGPYFLLLVTFP
jgi:hypothetical protein